MANIKKVDSKTILLDTPNVLYRGNTQEAFESKIIGSFVQGKPVYHGFTEAGIKRTYVTESLVGAIIHVRNKSLKDIGGTCDIFTKYPLIMGIRAGPYLDRLRRSDEGDGIFIEGKIDANDISVLLSSECYRLKEPLGRGRGHKPMTSYSLLMEELGSYAFDKKSSLVNKHHTQEVSEDLELLCFGMGSKLIEHGQKQKIVEAIAYLKRKLEGN